MEPSPSITDRLGNAVITVLLACLGYMIAARYLQYLNNPPPGFWTSYFDIDQSNEGFIFILSNAKLAMFAAWVCAAVACVRLSGDALQKKHVRPNTGTMWRSLTVGLLFCFSVVAYNPPDIELAPYFFINSVAYGLLAIALFVFPFAQPLYSVTGKGFLRLLRLEGYDWCILAAFAVFCVALYLSGAVFHYIPMPYDTSAQIVHARLIASGQWFRDPLLLPDFFAMDLMVSGPDGRWFSQYPPGHLIMLAAGLLIGHPEIVNPFAGAMTAVAIYLLARETYGIHTAKIAALLSTLCVYMIFMSSEYMNHATALCSGTFFMWGYLRVVKRPHWLYGIIAGGALGYCFITRPYSALALSIVPAVYALYLVARAPRKYTLPMALMAAVVLCFVGFQLYFNKITTGDPYVFGYQLMKGDWHNPFTAEAGEKLTGSEMEKNLRENLQRLTWLNRMLFEWPVPSLLLVALVMALRGGRRDERLLFLTIVSQFATCQFLPGNVDGAWGPRLVYEIIGLLIVLSAKGVTILPALLRVLGMKRRRLSFYYGYAVLLLASFYAFSFQHNLRLDTLSRINRIQNLTGNPIFYEQIMRQVVPPALVFVPPEQFLWVSFTNPPSSASPVVFAANLKAENRKLRPHFPRRNVYTAYYDGVRVVVTKVGVTPALVK